MQKNLRENNNISVLGTIVSDYKFSHEMFGEGFYIFYLKVNRLSEVNDILPITVSERLIDEHLFKLGAIVEIKGQLRSYNNVVEKKNQLILSVFAKEVNFNLLIDKNPNQVVLNGFLCKTPIYRKTPFGREISDILLAVNRSYNKSDYIPCIAWGRNAKFVNTLEIGQNIIISGRLQSRNYSKKLENGNIIEKVAYEVSISKLEIVKPENLIKNTEENIENIENNFIF